MFVVDGFGTKLSFFFVVVVVDLYAEACNMSRSLLGNVSKIGFYDGRCRCRI